MTMKDCHFGALPSGSRKFESENPEIAAVWRILDANFNRAAEGLRVVEEYSRFALEDAFLTRRLKEMRHSLTAVALSLDSESLRLIFRDTKQDVGTSITTRAETIREGVSDVALASFQRVQQALRSLEEYGKIVSQDIAQQCEAIRYDCYTLEKAIVGVRNRSTVLNSARVYVLLDGKKDAGNFERIATEIVEHADVIQLRDKQLADGHLLSRAKLLRAITRNTPCLFIVNDRPDIAILSEADGVHLGQDELSVREARRLVGESRFIGVSTHSIAQVRCAILDGANYLGCGPTFPSRTKTFGSFPGVDFLREAASETSLPCFAIGGIGLENVDQVIEAGFFRVALQNAISDGDAPPKEVIRRFKEKLPLIGS
jgi:thiamine-phosphate pyrophosphorylase